MVARRTRMQVIVPCVAGEVSLKPGTYNGERRAHTSADQADAAAANTYALWPPKHLVPVMVTDLVEQGIIRSLD